MSREAVSSGGFFPGLAARIISITNPSREKALSPAEPLESCWYAGIWPLWRLLALRIVSHKLRHGLPGEWCFSLNAIIYSDVVCNLLPYNDASPDQNLARTPAEQSNGSLMTICDSRTALGYLDYINWPSRRVGFSGKKKGKPSCDVISLCWHCATGLLDHSSLPYRKKNRKTQPGTSFVSQSCQCMGNSTTILVCTCRITFNTVVELVGRFGREGLSRTSHPTVGLEWWLKSVQGFAHARESIPCLWNI
jgi:hypothetical protein